MKRHDFLHPDRIWYLQKQTVILKVVYAGINLYLIIHLLYLSDTNIRYNNHIYIIFFILSYISSKSLIQVELFLFLFPVVHIFLLLPSYYFYRLIGHCISSLLSWRVVFMARTDGQQALLNHIKSTKCFVQGFIEDAIEFFANQFSLQLI